VSTSATDIQLSEGSILLRPSSDLDYWVELADQYKYCELDKDQIRKGFNDFGHKFWDVYYDGIRRGVIFLSSLKGVGFSLDGYKDQSVKTPFEVSFKATQLVCEYVDRDMKVDLWTGHHVKNRLATRMVKALGFVPMILDEKIDKKYVWFLRSRR